MFLSTAGDHVVPESTSEIKTRHGRAEKRRGVVQSAPQQNSSGGVCQRRGVPQGKRIAQNSPRVPTPLGALDLRSHKDSFVYKK